MTSPGSGGPPEMAAGGPRLGPGAEFELIARMLGRVRGQGGAIPGTGPGDDAVVIPGTGLVISTDLTVEDVHFRRSWLSMRELGRRAAIVALSDVAAMAAEPVGILVSLALPEGDEARAPELYEGIREALEETGGTVLGGDLSRSPGPLVLDVVAVGRSERPILRSGARPGDTVWVTGRLGGAALAVREWLAGATPPIAAKTAWIRPHARTAEALWLAEHVRPSALIDLSDGLAGDAGHLAAAGGVAVVLDRALIPLAPDCADSGEGAADALHGGEDYELLFTVHPEAMGRAVETFRGVFGLELHPVGEVVEGEGVLIREEAGAPAVPVPRGGYSHWRDLEGST